VVFAAPCLRDDPDSSALLIARAETLTLLQ
jgi:hypothetical protein